MESMHNYWMHTHAQTHTVLYFKSIIVTVLNNIIVNFSYEITSTWVIKVLLS